jgi:hypothetical protein
MVRPTLVKSEGGRTNVRRWAGGVGNGEDGGNQRGIEDSGDEWGGKRISLNVHLCYSICASKTRVSASGYTEMKKRIQWEGRKEQER